MKQTFLEEKKKPRRVDFDIYKEDFDAAMLGALGMSSRFIESRTSLSHGKIAYRLKKAHVRRSDYRDGTSVFARIVLKHIAPLAKNEMRAYLKDS